MKTVRDIKKLENIPVLVRAALNVPVTNGKVTGGFRLHRAVPTIEYLLKKHARVVLIGHIGDTGTETLLPVYEAMKEFFPRMVFCPVSSGLVVREAVRALPAGGVLMLENLRRNRGEVMNDESFARELAGLADIFVEDSFDVCHRKHASVVGVSAFLPSYAGLLVEEEVRELGRALKPKKPSLAIVGGAKFATKEGVLKRLLSLYDKVFVGGALANDFMAEQGLPVERSLRSKEGKEEIQALLTHKKLLLPIDTVIGAPEADAKHSRVGVLDGLPPYEAVLDDGPRTLEMLSGLASNAQTILWNGPLGNYENGFTEGTEVLAQAIAKSPAFSIVGGGDTVAAIEKLGLNDQFGFISTGGGAMLEYLATGSLPGLDVLN